MLSGISAEEAFHRIQADAYSVVIVDAREMGDIVRSKLLHTLYLGALEPHEIPSHLDRENLMEALTEQSCIRTMIVVDLDGRRAPAYAEALTACLPATIRVAWVRGGLAAIRASHHHPHFLASSSSSSSTDNAAMKALYAKRIHLMNGGLSKRAAPCPAIASILPDFLYLGDVSSSRFDVLEANGIRNIIRLYPRSHHDDLEYHQNGIRIQSIPLEDSSSNKMLPCLDQVLPWLEELRSRQERVLIHCQAGVSRSTSIVLAYLMLRERLTLREAHGVVFYQRPIIQPNDGFSRELLELDVKTHGQPSTSRFWLMDAFRMINQMDIASCQLLSPPSSPPPSQQQQ